MKFLVCLFVVILTVLPESYGYTNRVTAKHPSYPGMCYFFRSPDPIKLFPGQSQILQNTCERAFCDKTYEVIFYGCEIPKVPNGCRIVRDISYPYPNCCPRVSCF